MFQETRLGSARAYDVRDPRLVTFLQQSAWQLVTRRRGGGPGFRYPGPMPITVERRHVGTIRGNSYMMTPKADGVRAMLLFVQYYIDDARQQVCALVMRDGSCRLVTLHTHPHYYRDGGSAFDGELVTLRDGLTSRLEIFDCYAVRGTPVVDATLAHRLRQVDELVRATDGAPPGALPIAAKPYYPFDRAHALDASAFVSNAHQLAFNTDGIVLVPTGRMRHVGTSEDNFKLKASPVSYTQSDAADESLPV